MSNVDLGITREFQITERWRLQFRAGAFNVSNTPAFAFGSDPGSGDRRTNVSNMKLNADGTISALNDNDEITHQPNTGRENGQQRVFRFGLRLSF